MKFIILLLVVFSAPWGLAMPIAAEESFDSDELMLNMTKKFLNVDSFDQYLAMATYMQLIPLEIGDAWMRLNETQKEEVVTFISDVMHKRIVVPEGVTDGQWIRQHAPVFHDLVTSLNATFHTHLNNLKPSTRQQLQEWSDEAADLFGNQRPAGETTAQNLKLIRDYFVRIRQMKAEIREDLKSQFPWTMSIVEGNGFKLYISLLTVFKEVFEMLGTMSSRKAVVAATAAAAI